MVVPKPFHLSIVDALTRAQVQRDWVTLNVLAGFITETAIPQNHDAILMAWQRARDVFPKNDDRGVTPHIAREKIRTS